MGNRLFIDARDLVQNAIEASSQAGENKEEAIKKAQNALSSAYANSTNAEKRQLSQLQQKLDSIK